MLSPFEPNGCTVSIIRKMYLFLLLLLLLYLSHIVVTHKSGSNFDKNNDEMTTGVGNEKVGKRMRPKSDFKKQEITSCSKSSS